MDTIIAILLGIAPGIFWLLFFYSRDTRDPEPPVWIVLVFLLGAAVSVPVGFIEAVFLDYAGTFLVAVVLAPVAEEVAKFWVVEKTVYRTRVFDEPIDGIVYAAAAGLGFATLENILYVLDALDLSVFHALEVAAVRAVLSVPAHVLFSTMWGFSLGISQVFPSGRGLLVAGGLFLAVSAHGLFNFLVLAGYGMPVLVLVLVPLLWGVAMNHVRVARALRPVRGRP
ncbi:MAG: PrsW family glutamic-type intramembrane protease [Methanolinea sp.]|nr:PrsW family glutamic-type intramembrane protease [Methanolinea sp.]